jgi:iron complex transport system substrate-binding protein
MRIVSLLPSATEIVCALGLIDQLVGVTHECDFPPGVLAKPKVTRTHIPTDASSAEIDRLVRDELAGQRRALYSLDHETMRRLRPDLIVTQTLCDVCAVNDADVRLFMDAASGDGRAPQIVHLEPTRFEHLFDNTAEVAQAAGAAERAVKLNAALRARIATVAEQCENPKSKIQNPKSKLVVLEWLDPLFSCGHWTPELVALAGGHEPLAKPGERSRQITPDELVAADPDLILIACCGYSVERSMRDVPVMLRDACLANLRCVRNGRVYVTDGSAYFSRPGPRLVDSLEILAHLVDPRRHPLPAHIPPAISAFAEAGA